MHWKTNMLLDTIVGLSTTLRAQAVSVLRLSGDRSIEMAEKISHKDFTGVDHEVIYAHLYESSAYLHQRRCG